MDKLKTAMSLLPPDIKENIEGLKAELIEEIRLRVGMKPTVLIMGREKTVRETKMLPHEIKLLMEKASGASVQAHLNELRDGYISYKGLRIGICASAIYEEGRLVSFQNISSLNIRIPHRFQGSISDILDQIGYGKFESTLIVSPPGYGKTSLLRELVRQLSLKGLRISVLDERNELACMDRGISYFDMGEHTDILTGVKKSEGAMMLLRGMNPEIIAFDEISKKEDFAAIYELAGCGVEILATAHGQELSSLRQRPSYRKLLDENIFKNLISIRRTDHRREYFYQRIVP